MGLGARRVTVALFGLCFTSCATLLTGGEQDVEIRTDPPDAKFTVYGETYQGHSTVALRRGISHEIRFERDGYEPKTVALDASMNPEMWLNLLLGPLFPLGFLVDSMTGAANTLSPQVVTAVLHPKTLAPITTEALAAGPEAPQEAEIPGRQPVVAVLPMRVDAGGPSPGVAAAFADLIRARLAQAGVLVIDRGAQEAALAALILDEKAASYAACVDEACQIPLGRALAATHLLRTKVSALEGTWHLTGEVVDLSREVIVDAVSMRLPASNDALLEAVDGVAGGLAQAPWRPNF